MATCLNSINNNPQYIGLSSGVTNRVTVNASTNALFLLENELDQSVFFNIKLVGNYSNIAITMTIYNATTLAVFGTLNINQQNVSSSFSISAGRYIICFRPAFGSFVLDITPTFISYNNVASFIAKSYIGYYSTFDLTVKRPTGICNRRLLYTLVDGELPEGLTLLDNGIVTGFLPILDCDPKNKDLPTSNTWYERISDSEYITPWGRSYRFKVHLTLFDDRTKVDIKWFYVSIINDFTKNIALVNNYKILENNKIAAFEDQIKLDNINLCNIKNNIENNIEKSDDELFYESVENHKFDGDDENHILYKHNTDFIDNNSQESEYIIYDLKMNSNVLDIIEYFINNFNNEDEQFLLSLKDSTMFNSYLLENNIDKKYINMDLTQYNDISMEFVILNDSEYLLLKNDSKNVFTDISSMTDVFDEKHDQALKQLPLHSYSHYGWSSTFKLFKP